MSYPYRPNNSGRKECLQLATQENPFYQNIPRIVIKHLQPPSWMHLSAFVNAPTSLVMAMCFCNLFWVETLETCFGILFGAVKPNRKGLEIRCRPGKIPMKSETKPVSTEVLWKLAGQVQPPKLFTNNRSSQILILPSSTPKDMCLAVQSKFCSGNGCLLWGTFLELQERCKRQGPDVENILHVQESWESLYSIPLSTGIHRQTAHQNFNHKKWPTRTTHEKLIQVQIIPRIEDLGSSHWWLSYTAHFRHWWHAGRNGSPSTRLLGPNQHHQNMRTKEQHNSMNCY